MRTTMTKLRLATVVVPAVPLAACAGMQSAGEGGWMTLIDGGRGLDRWDKVGAANWRAADGVIEADTGEKGQASFIVTRRPYGDFQLRVEFRASPDANSGIYMRCLDVSNITDRTCYEANIFDQGRDQADLTAASSSRSRRRTVLR
jgi:hypothetical protein